jgi:hypothetical protein
MDDSPNLDESCFYNIKNEIFSDDQNPVAQVFQANILRDDTKIRVG